MKKGINIGVKNGRRVVEGLGYYKEKTVGDLRELVKESAKNYGNAPGFKYKDRDGKIVEKTYSEFDVDIDSLGTALINLGLKGKRISILSENRYEWGVSYFAVVNGAGIAVPLDKYLQENEVVNLIGRGKVEAIFYSSAFQDMMDKIAPSSNHIKFFICMDEFERKDDTDERFMHLQDLLNRGKALMMKGEKGFAGAEIDRTEMSILLFTSGTTSISKGVMLSHANIASNISGVSSVIKIGPGDVHLSLLPLHHTFENTIGLCYMVSAGVCIAYSDGIKHVARNLQEYNVSILIAVPAIFEAMYRKVQEGINKSGKRKGFDSLVSLSGFLRKMGIDLRKTLFKSVFKQLGPSLRIAVSGAAPLDPAVIEGFDQMGLKLLQGYGLTETSPVISVNNDFVNKKGTVGYPLKGIEVAIDSPDENGIGEIITRGENVMLGYYENPEETKAAIDEEGWFKTGDLGVIDEEGFLSITGRAKSMIVLTNGKKAFPEEYEVLLGNIKGVRESMVWGNEGAGGDVQICAKLVIDPEAMARPDGTVSTEQEISAMINEKIREINKTLPQYKIIRYFLLSYDELAKTTTLKVKRPVEMEKIKSSLAQLNLDMRKASGRFV